jgi:hypothetical protein
MKHRYEDDDMLNDGQTGRVPLMLRDALTSGLHRPGFRVADAGLRDARQEARDAYEHGLTNAWRTGDKKVTQRDPQGRLMSTLEEEEDVTDALPTRKGMTVDQMRHDHEQRMSGIYGAYDASIREQWRK